MKKVLRCFLFLLPLAIFSNPAGGMSTALRTTHAVYAAKPLVNNQWVGTLEQWISKHSKKVFKNQFKANKGAKVDDSNGRTALFLLMGSLVVVLFLSSIAYLALGLYFAALFFAILGLVKDEQKSSAWLAFGLAMLPILLVVLFWLNCRNGRCFD